MPIRALTLDLDDTLWPFAPVAARIQEALTGWLAEHAPRAAQAFDPRASMKLIDEVREELPEMAHDLAFCRREALRRMFASAGEDPELVDPVFEVMSEARQRVDLYPDAAPALDRLADRFPLVAVTNGNADLERIGASRWFEHVIAAHEIGIAKPDPRIFHLACEHVGVAPAEVLHVGDDLVTDVEGAIGAGLQAAWVHRDLAGEVPDGVLRARDLGELADRLLRS
jgi:FMN hydrolase / 5-amino-6-(5-phospho-D-ribitylamino)uracil phosphatase